MPGRCAAPPAPAMITSRPRLAAELAYSAIHAGVRCADTTRHSCGTAKRDSTSSAGFIVSQSDLLPMITPTRGDVIEGSRSQRSQAYSIAHPTNEHRRWRVLDVPRGVESLVMKPAVFLIVLA